MKKLILFTLSALLFVAPCRADEGMWLVQLLEEINYREMQKGGLRLTPEQLYSETVPSIKDAVVALDGGSCTGSIISDRALLITNHHCAFDDIQNLSTLEHDYLENGFWASSQEEEIPIPGKSVMFLRKVIDVTEEYRALLDETAHRSAAFYNSSRRIDHLLDVKYREEGLECSSYCMMRGDRYYLYFYEVFTDIRLVGAPPRSVGAFGGDTDNWTWPQHKCDFALYRVYGDAEGRPSDYSAANRPITPRYVLPVSERGLQAEDFVMTMGYPASTNRYCSSFEVKERLTITNPILVKSHGERLKIIQTAMRSNEVINLQYASKAFSEGNVWKLKLGETEYGQAYDVVGIKEAKEREMQAWIDADPGRKARYGNLLPNLQAYFERNEEREREITLTQAYLIRGAEIYTASLRFHSLANSMERQKATIYPSDSERVTAFLRSTQSRMKDFNAALDQTILTAMLTHYLEEMPEASVPQLLKDWMKEYQSVEALCAMIYQKSILSDIEKIKATLGDGLTFEEVASDPAVKLSTAVNDALQQTRQLISEDGIQLAKMKNDYTEILLAMSDRPLPPNANSTMRLTYGHVGGYEPRDGEYREPFSTLRGLKEKYRDGDPEFDLPDDYHHLIENSDATLPACFVTNQDITGGNSGSSVLNGDGAVVGLAFDGNWESMAGDIYFHPDFNKCVAVDIRYVLWFIAHTPVGSQLLHEINPLH